MKNTLDNPTFEGTHLEDLTMRQLRELPDGTTASSGVYSCVTKVGKFWIDGETGLVCKLSDLQLDDSEELATPSVWSITHVPEPYATALRAKREYEGIRADLAESKIFEDDREMLPREKVQHLIHHFFMKQEHE